MNILSDHQSGFRKRYSTGTCLVEFQSVIYTTTWKKGRLSGVLFLDLRKAFDTVNHHIMLCKLSQLNMSPEVIHWFKSYLCNRYQLTRANSTYSDILPVTCGVPQGSILGPLMFILYINSLPDAMLNADVFLYADDTAIVCSGTDEQEIVTEMKRQLNCASVWLKDHRLSLNLGKTKGMFFGTAPRLRNFDTNHMMFNEERIVFVDDFKYLGSARQAAQVQSTR